MVFLPRTILRFKEVASLAPTTQYVINRLMSHIPVTSARIIAELGAGDGCISRSLVESMREDAVFHVFEKQPEFFQKLLALQEHNPGMRLHNDMFDAQQRVAYKSCDVVVSTIPVSTLGSLRSKYFSVLQHLLKEDGVYVHLQYHPRAIDILKKQFPRGSAYRISHRTRDRLSGFGASPKCFVARGSDMIVRA